MSTVRITDIGAVNFKLSLWAANGQHKDLAQKAGFSEKLDF